MLGPAVAMDVHVAVHDCGLPVAVTVLAVAVVAKSPRIKSPLMRVVEVEKGLVPVLARPEGAGGSMGCTGFSPEISTATIDPSVNVPATVTTSPGVVVVTFAHSIQVRVVGDTTMPALRISWLKVPAAVSDILVTDGPVAS